MMERHAAQAPALRERHPQIFNIQFSIGNSGLSGLGKERSKRSKFNHEFKKTYPDKK